MTARNIIARDIHARMVDDERFGYDWDERWGNRPERWTVDGLSFDIKVGDYDCSSSSITAWKKALTGTDYADALDEATYTGNIRSVFTRSGLFDWKPMSFTAQPGDLYLAEGHHVAMCQTVTPDILSEFSSNEHGGCYGGDRGDQTGWESHKRGFYSYPWDGILHYNGKADEEGLSVNASEIIEQWYNGIDGNSGLLSNVYDTNRRVTALENKIDELANSTWAFDNEGEPPSGADNAWKKFNDLKCDVDNLNSKVGELDKKLDEILKALG